MAVAAEEHKIDIDEEQITIRELAIIDPDIVSYFGDLDQSENPEQKLVEMLKIGIVVTKSTGIANNVGYVDKAFDNLEERLKNKLESTFGKEGRFSNLLDEHFGKDGMLIREWLDPNREKSPLYQLLREIEKPLVEIRNQLVKNEAVKEEADKGTRKGMEFEEWCGEKLEGIAKTHSDKFEHSGTVEGNVTGSKKGDYTMVLGDTGKKIVFEIKNKGTISLPEIQREMDDSIKNRGADYGIFIAKNKKSLPRHVGWFAEYDGRHLVCAVEEDGEPFMDGGMVHLAYKWARARLAIESANDGRLDPSLILERTKAIRGKIDELKKIKTKCTSITKDAELIKGITDDMHKVIQEELDDIIESLNSDEV